jgi:hypothetical protein
MHIFIKTITTIVLGSALSLTSLVSANALPIQGIVLPSAHDVEQVQYRHYRGGDGWYRGHRGYRDYRPGYRRYDGYWYPLAAFGAGALIGGALAAPAARPSYGSRHVQWCSERYRTYDPGSDTYVPSVGVRARCVSPY